MGLKVRDAMAKTFSTAAPSDTVAHVAQLMKKEDSGFIPICVDDQLFGVVTDRDIVIRCLAEQHENPGDETVEHIVSHRPLTIDADKDLEHAGELMGRARVRRLVVVDNGRVVGVISHGNLVQATGGQGPAEKATVGVTRGA